MQNLVPNGDFSQIENGSPVQWQSMGNEQNVDQRLETVVENGNPCARLTCTRCEGSGGSNHAMLAQIGGAALERGKFYEFSCRAKAEGLAGRTVAVSMTDTQAWQECGVSTSLVLGPSWKEFRTAFRASRSVGETGRLQFWYHETGAFYLDDVRITELAVGEVKFTDVVAPAGGKNLVPNGSFEVGGAGWGSFGNVNAWGNLCHLHGTVQGPGGTHGASFLRVSMGEGRMPMLYFDYLNPVATRPTMALAANLGWIPVEPGQAYTLSCDMRASVDGARGALGVVNRDPAGGSGRGRGQRPQRVQLTTSWQRYSYTFRPEFGYVYVMAGPDLAEDARVDVDIDGVQLEKGEQATPFEPRTPVEVGVEPGAPGGIFTVGEPADLHLRASNEGGDAVNVRFAFEGKDFFDQEVTLPPVTLAVDPASPAERTVRLPGDWKGYYRVRVRYESEHGGGSQDVRLALVPPVTHDDSVIGINHAFNDAYLIQLARKAGVAWYRDWSLKWQHLEPAPGEYHWDVGDVQIDRVLKEGVHLMALLPPFPSADWSATTHPAGEPPSRSPGRQALPPEDPTRLAEFVGKVVSRYKDRVKVWEFLNEPVFAQYALPRNSGYGPDDYARLLLLVAAAMRKADPECKVMGGIAGGPDTYTKEIIEAGCLNYVDIFNLHIYPGTSPPEFLLPGMDALLALMDAHGGRKPIWMTEFSYYGEDDLPRTPFIPSGNWIEARLLKDERECAEMTVRFCVVMMARGVQKVFIHSGSTGTVNSGGTGCCIFEYGGVPSRVFPALAVFADLMGGAPQYVGETRPNEDAYYFAFETGERSVLVCWDTSGRTEMPVPAGARCLDFMGNELAGPTVTLTQTPVYVLGASGVAKELLPH